MNWVLGIDGGGTGCRAALADHAGRRLGSGGGGAANIMTDPDGALASILQATNAAMRQAGLNSDAHRTIDAVLGLAGANVGPYAANLSARLPFRRSRIESDARTALEGALGTHDGAIAIIGTGTAFIARRGAAIRALGGWGFVVGDQGSGARTGRMLLEETLLANDGIRPGSSLSDAVLARFDNDPRKLVEFAVQAKPKAFGAFMPLILEHEDDPLARRLLETAARDLSEAIRALHLYGGERLCLLGGLAPFMGPRLSAELQPLIHAPLGDALDGALSMALAARGDGP